MATETVYACTFVEKTAQVDSYEKGCEGRVQTILCEAANITAPTLPDLIAAIGERWFLNIDDVWLADEEGVVDRIGYNRLETVECDVPDERELAAWREGKLTLYLADYYFHIEKREVSPITVEEFALASIKTH